MRCRLQPDDGDKSTAAASPCRLAAFASRLPRCGTFGACPFESCGEVPIVPCELGKHPSHIGALDLFGSLLFLVCKRTTGPSCVPKFVVA